MEKLSHEPDEQISVNKLFWWILTTITVILLTVGGAWGSAIAARQQSFEDRQQKLEDHNADIDRQLGEINGKVDVLIQRSR